MERTPLTPEAFLAGCELLFAHVRVRESDRWGELACKVKYASFRGAFPEVDREQFLWACEQWIQGTAGQDFLRFPAWAELMTVLYGTEGGLANRSYGFKPTLPAWLQPSPQQLALLPRQPQTLKPHPGEEYRLVTPAEARPLLPPRREEEGMTDEQWEAYLRGEASHA
jgi:hypothetical protein